MDVTLFRWPAELSRRERLADEGLPRLLLVEGGELPPIVVDVVEDWIRVPADESDIRARVATLQARYESLIRGVAPVLDDDGVIRI
ncbi:MAG: helix-turn-helix domain-containing protein, partial [Actinobacteria bacterium]